MLLKLKCYCNYDCIYLTLVFLQSAKNIHKLSTISKKTMETRTFPIKMKDVRTSKFEKHTNKVGRLT